MKPKSFHTAEGTVQNETTALTRQSEILRPSIREGAPVSVPSGEYLFAEHKLRSPKAFRRYLIEGKHADIQGWVKPGALSAIAAFSGLQSRLGILGHVCEIGVHHGRYFLALSLLRRPGEKSLAVDVFDLQEFNVDQSGLGDLEIFNKNVADWLSPEPDVVVAKADSLTVTGQDVMRRLDGGVRLFSIDGSHTREHTLNDLAIAEQSLIAGGVAIVDDFLNPAWPGVIEAIVAYLDRPAYDGKLVPIGYGDNKFYFTTPGFADGYRRLVSGPLRFAVVDSKLVALCGKPMLYFALKPPNFVFASIKPSLNQSLPLTKGAEAVTILGASSSPEANGTWGLGTWFGIAVDVGSSSVAPRANLEIETSCFRHAEDPTPKVGCYANGRHIIDIDFPEGRDEGRVAVPVRISEHGESGRLEIWFNNPRAASPSSLGVSKDSRCLSLLLKSVTLKP